MGKLRPSGGYRDLRSFQTATMIYDATYWFCERFLPAGCRTRDQMVQAARSGRQNIAEGSRASATSSQTELRLVNVARSSLEELLLDYEDFLRQRHLEQWEADGPEALAVRRVAQDRADLSDLTDAGRHALYAQWLDHEDPAVRANALLCLIHQTNTLLDRQIEALEGEFIGQGGYSERLAAARLARRGRQGGHDQTDQTDQSDQTDQTDRTDRPHRPHRADPGDAIPPCPRCGRAMVLRTAQKGKRAGKQFWGCSGYPDCKGLVDIGGTAPRER